MTLADLIIAASFADRHPSIAEYQNGSPAERRAILARWKEINFQNGLLHDAGRIPFFRRWPETHGEAEADAARWRRQLNRSYREEEPSGYNHEIYNAGHQPWETGQ